MESPQQPRAHWPLAGLLDNQPQSLQEIPKPSDTHLDCKRAFWAQLPKIIRSSTCFLRTQAECSPRQSLNPRGLKSESPQQHWAHWPLAGLLDTQPQSLQEVPKPSDTHLDCKKGILGPAPQNSQFNHLFSSNSSRHFFSGIALP